MFELFVYECFRSCRRGFLDFARNDKFVRGLLTAKPSVGRDALVPPHNVHSWFRFAHALLYNVISTGVRTTVRTQWRNPPRESFDNSATLTFLFDLLRVAGSGTQPQGSEPLRASI